SNLAPLEKLTNLQSLSLNGTQISNFAPLEKLTNLQSLSLSRTQISNFAPLEKLTNLQRLDVRGLKNVTPEAVKPLGRLRFLTVDAARVQEFQRAIDRPDLEILGE